jgi:hypothetical protein
MTHFYPDHVLIDGQAAAAGYSLSKKTQLITVFVDLPTGERAKLRFPVEHEQYAEVYAAWNESRHYSEKNAETPDLFAMLNEPIARPVFDPSAMAIDMQPAARPEPKKEPATPPIIGKGFRIVFNEELSRTQIIFTKFPCKAVRELVKEAGFFWSPTNQAWQKKLTAKARRAAEEVAAKLAGIKIAA